MKGILQTSRLLIRALDAAIVDSHASMFSSAVQPSLVSIFSSTGSEPLSTFLSSTDKSLPSDSFICFCNDATSLPHPRLPATLVSPSTNEQGAPDYALQQTVLHIQSPTLRTTFIRCPPFRDANGPSGHLGMKHPWIHFQVRNMGREFSLEIGLVDQSGREGVVRCSTFQVPYLCVQIVRTSMVALMSLNFCITFQYRAPSARNSAH